MRQMQEFILKTKDGQEITVQGQNQKKGEKEFRLTAWDSKDEWDEDGNLIDIVREYDFKLDDIIYGTNGIPYEIKTIEKTTSVSRKFSSTNWLLQIEESEDNLILLIAAKRKRDLAKLQTLAA
jgi:hypothetical protein